MQVPCHLPAATVKREEAPGQERGSSSDCGWKQKLTPASGETNMSIFAATVRSYASLTFHPKISLASLGFSREGVHIHTRKQAGSKTGMAARSSEGVPEMLQEL